ncbi:phosphatidate phosphatase App1 family protein [Bremerella alba]|nr:phosphatase domain-containing protein [Bremerella alba]
MFPDETALSNLKDTERVVLYPSYAYPAPDQSGWILQVHGSVFEAVPENLPRKIMIRVLARLMGATQEQLETSVFKQRILGFTVYQHGGKQIAVKIGDKTYQLRGKSKKNGQFRGTILIPNEDVDTIAMTVGATRHVRYAIHSQFDVATPLEGLVKLIDHHGVSIISDIDDTVKHTQVATRKDMLANTFLHEFATVPGMVPLYQKWQQQGAAFHYVTSSPWQLFEPLSDLFRDQGLPDGSFHMKSVRFRDPTVLQLFIARRWGKRKAIKQLLRTFPDRKFVLVGDSGEKDPETYGVMARKFPDQVVKIFIRDLGGKKSSDQRFAQAFKRVPQEKWQRFTCPSQLQEYDLPTSAQFLPAEANGDGKSLPPP